MVFAPNAVNKVAAAVQWIRPLTFSHPYLKQSPTSTTPNLCFLGNHVRYESLLAGFNGSIVLKHEKENRLISPFSCFTAQTSIKSNSNSESQGPVEKTFLQCLFVLLGGWSTKLWLIRRSEHFWMQSNEDLWAMLIFLVPERRRKSGQNTRVWNDSYNVNEWTCTWNSNVTESTKNKSQCVWDLEDLGCYAETGGIFLCLGTFTRQFSQAHHAKCSGKATHSIVTLLEACVWV